MDNPITQIRLELGLSRREFCAAAGIRRDGLYLLESGQVNRPQERVLALLERLGYDSGSVLREYEAYRQHLGSQALGRVRRREHAGA